MKAIAKQTFLGKRKVWGVYDVDRAAYPGLLNGYGKVAQDHPTEEEAQAEADRLNNFYTGGK